MEYISTKVIKSNSRCIFNQTEIPNGKKKIQQGIEGSSSTWCNKKSKNDPKIVHHGQVKSITLDEIEGAYKIATKHVGQPSNFLWSWEGLFGRSGGVSDCEELVVHLVEYLTRLLGLDYFWMCFVRIPDRTSIHLRLAKAYQSDLGSFRWSTSIPLDSRQETGWWPVRNH